MQSLWIFWSSLRGRKGMIIAMNLHFVPAPNDPCAVRWYDDRIRTEQAPGIRARSQSRFRDIHKMAP
jgi:hypothetical protein